MNQESSKVSDLSIGNLRIALSSPGPRPETTDRISLWWGVTTSALALARFIESDFNVNGMNLLELGSGVGLTGMVAAIKGAKVTFTDYVPEALQTAKLNANANGVPEKNVEFKILDWETSDPPGQFDVIIGSEIVYEYFFHGCLTELMLSALQDHGVILIADRPRMVVDRFIGRLIRKGCICRKHSCRVDDYGFPEQDVTIFVIRKP